MTGAGLISDVSDLTPRTSWRETKWAWTAEEDLVDHQTSARLCPAVLLPFHDGRPDWDGFFALIRWIEKSATHYGVEFACVLNADTGYIFQLDDSLYAEVLRRFRSEFPALRFIAGVTARPAPAEGESFRAETYRPLLDIAQSHENCEVMIMTSRALDQLGPERRRDGYQAIAEFLTRPALVHALEPAFVPWATPFSPWLLSQLAENPKFIGGKVSTLSEPHFLYWTAMQRDLKWKFQPHSGDDFGLASAIRMGMPLLIGAAASAAPLICAAKEMWLHDAVSAKRFKTGANGFDTRVYKLFEALQSFQDQVFRLDERGSASAYKHSTAHFLKGLGLIQSDEVHPDCPDRRTGDESARMREAALRPSRLAKELDIPFFQRA
jgi:dihydrodipicolinate synthase/N-acetylneuraminate lyase